MSIAAKVIGLLGGVYNLFPKGGTTGGIVVRQPGGTPGTNEGQIWEDGANLNIQHTANSVNAPRLVLDNSTIRVSVMRASDGAITGQMYAVRLCASNAGADEVYVTGGSDTSGGGVLLVSTRQVKWTNNANNPGSNQDTGLARQAANVFQATNGGAGAGFFAWFQATGISAAGNSQGTATALTAQSNDVSTVAASAGVVLPTAAAVAGVPVRVYNGGANALSIYPPTGGSIDALSANAAYSLPVGKTQIITAVSATQWRTTQLG